MDNQKTFDRKLETIAWGLLFIWWGLRWSLLITLPDGSGLIGTALVLLGVNTARFIKGIPTRGFTTLLAVLALAWGGLELANSVALLPIRLPVFEIMLIVVGVFLVVAALLKSRLPGLEVR